MVVFTGAVKARCRKGQGSAADMHPVGGRPHRDNRVGTALMIYF